MAQPPPRTGNLEELPPWVIPMALGSLGFVIGVSGWVPVMSLLRYVDIPFTLLLFPPCVWLGLRNRQRSDLAVVGTVLSALGCASALLALVIQRSHPWLG